MGRRLWQKNNQGYQDIEDRLFNLGKVDEVQDCKNRRGQTRLFKDRKIHNCLLKRLKEAEAENTKSQGFPTHGESGHNSDYILLNNIRYL